MLQDSLGFILLDRLGHHIEDIMHHSSTQLEIEMGLDSLFRDCLGDTFTVTTLELTSKQVSKPVDVKKKRKDG